MVDRVTEVIRVPTIMNVIGEIVARNVSYEDFLRGYDGQHVEWVQGHVIRMSPVDERHDALTRFVDNLFQVYLELTGGGRVLQDPMLMRLGPDLPARQPDLQVLLPESIGRLAQNSVEGPADLVVEVVSPESVRRDTVEKLLEYEAGGVHEYWILDPQRKSAQFWILSPEGVYQPGYPDPSGWYTSTILNRLTLRPDLFWRDPLPGYIETLRLVEGMLSGE